MHFRGLIIESIVSRGTLVTACVSAFVLVALLTCCGPKNVVNPRLSKEMPNKILWAWERPEDLRFLDPNEFGVAFLAQTISLEKETVAPKPRRQPLEVAPGTYMIAVTRVETNKDGSKRPTFDAAMAKKVAGLIDKTLNLPDVAAVQVDFDAVVSERLFYRVLIGELRGLLDKHAERSVRTPLTMTSLASWCTGDAWFNDFPVDEAVPMVFQMGADSDKIKRYLANGNDWNEPLCRGSNGISLEEGWFDGMKDGRRTYFFKHNAWTPSDIAKLPH